MALIAWVICIAALEFDGDDVFRAMVVFAASLVIGDGSFNVNSMDVHFIPP